MKKNRKKYDREFKQKATELSILTKSVAKDVEVKSVLYLK